MDKRFLQKMLLVAAMLVAWATGKSQALTDFYTYTSEGTGVKLSLTEAFKTALNASYAEYKGWKTGDALPDPTNGGAQTVTDMSGLFAGCTGVSTLDLTAFTVGESTTIASLLEGCTSLTDVELSASLTANSGLADIFGTTPNTGVLLVAPTQASYDAASKGSLFMGYKSIGAGIDWVYVEVNSQPRAILYGLNDEADQNIVPATLDGRTMWLHPTYSTRALDGVGEIWFKAREASTYLGLDAFQFSDGTTVIVPAAGEGYKDLKTTALRYALTIEWTGWATAWFETPVVAVDKDDTDIYYAKSVSDDELEIVGLAREVDKAIPANTGVFVNTSMTSVDKENGKTVLFQKSTSEATIESNLLEKAPASGQLAANEGYVLNIAGYDDTATDPAKKVVVGFVLYTGGKIGIDKAYIPASKITSGANMAPRLSIKLND